MHHSPLYWEGADPKIDWRHDDQAIEAIKPASTAARMRLAKR